MTPINYRRGLLAADEDHNQYFQTIRDVPALNWDEFRLTTAATYACLYKNGRLPGFSHEDAINYYAFCVGDSLSDRTVMIELPEIRVLTTSFVQSIKNEVLSTRPLWRVMIMSEDESRVVLIYPNAIRVGSAPIEADWQAELADIVRAEWEHREKREGPRRRQLSYLAERIVKSLPTISSQPFEVVAVFDNYKGDLSEWMVWVFFAGENAEDITVKYTDGVMGCDKYPVRDDGYFGPLFKDDDAKLWLRSWVYPPNLESLTIIRQKDYKPVHDAVYEMTISPDAVIREADLKRKEGPIRFAPL